MSSDGTNTYKWDAENRLVQIDYPGANNNSQFSYDGWGKNSKIIETVSGSVTSTRQFVWCGFDRSEERDASGVLVKQFFGGGEKNGATSSFLSKDELNSIREITDNSGNIVAQYNFDCFGRSSKIVGSIDTDFQFTGCFYHSRSRLNLMPARAYSSSLGRFLSRDPIEGSNLHAYVDNDPVNGIDPSGLDAVWGRRWLLIGGRHRGLAIQRWWNGIPIWTTLDPVFPFTPGGSVWVIETTTPFLPLGLPFSYNELWPITTAPGKVTRVLHEARQTMGRLRRYPKPYGVPGAKGKVTSNQVTGEILRNSGLHGSGGLLTPGGSDPIDWPPPHFPPPHKPLGPVDTPPCEQHRDYRWFGPPLPPPQTQLAFGRLHHTSKGACWHQEEHATECRMSQLAKETF